MKFSGRIFQIISVILLISAFFPVLWLYTVIAGILTLLAAFLFYRRESQPIILQTMRNSLLAIGISILLLIVLNIHTNIFQIGAIRQELHEKKSL